MSAPPSWCWVTAVFILLHSRPRDTERASERRHLDPSLAGLEKSTFITAGRLPVQIPLVSLTDPWDLDTVPLLLCLGGQEQRRHLLQRRCAGAAVTRG